MDPKLHENDNGQLLKRNAIWPNEAVESRKQQKTIRGFCWLRVTAAHIPHKSFGGCAIRRLTYQLVQRTPPLRKRRFFQSDFSGEDWRIGRQSVLVIGFLSTQNAICCNQLLCRFERSPHLYRLWSQSCACYSDKVERSWSWSPICLSRGLHPSKAHTRSQFEHTPFCTCFDCRHPQHFLLDNKWRIESLHRDPPARSRH